jgi:chaperone modulatory protein CbpM
MTVTRYALVRPPAAAPLLDLDSFARATGLHPELVRRLVALGLLEVVPDRTGRPWFPPGQVAAAARIQRLRMGFGLNYAAVGLVADLLDRIAELEAALRRQPARRTGGSSWT